MVIVAYTLIKHGRFRSIMQDTIIIMYIFISLYSFGNKKWTKMAPMSTAVSNPIVLMYNNQLYVCGGYNGAFQDTLQVYDTLTTSWSNVS